MQSLAKINGSGNQCYSDFKQYLANAGFTVYPVEFDCGFTKHPLVDIATKMGSFYWAFEYKSETDSISRGLEQVECYSKWFDYVVLVSENWLDHTKIDLFWELMSRGAGIWNYNPISDKCIIRKNPQLQSPDRSKRRLVELRFSLMNKTRFHRGSQAKLTF